MTLIDKRVYYFYQVVSHGGVRVAADTLDISPSVISRHIANLEKSLGVILLERHTKGAIPTQMGERLLACYRQMHSQEEHFKQEIDSLQGLKTGSVHISTGVGYLRYVSEAVNAFSHRYPNITIQISIHSSTEIIRRVVDNETDIGLLYNSINHPHLKSHYKSTHQLCVFMTPTHILAHQDIISITELSSEKLAFTDHTHGIRQVIGAAEAKLGIVLPTALLCNDMNLLKRHAASGGITILPEFMLYDEEVDLIMRPLSLSPKNETPLTAQADTQIITRRGRHLNIATQAMLGQLIMVLDKGLNQGSTL